jgi:hypothetical protein
MYGLSFTILIFKDIFCPAFYPQFSRAGMLAETDDDVRPGPAQGRMEHPGVEAHRKYPLGNCAGGRDDGQYLLGNIYLIYSVRPEPV